MGMLLVVDGADVCRAPIVSFTLCSRLREAGLTSLGPIVDRGLEARAGGTMCESAATRLGFTGPAIAHCAAHRSAPLTIDDIRSADLVLTAERAHRSAVVRMLPGTQAMVFTWKEALVLASVLVDRRRTGSLASPGDLAGLARALHGVRGTVPIIEPVVRTGPLHWRRVTDADPLSIGSGHDGHAEHRRITQETAEVAAALGGRLDTVFAEHRPEVRLPDPVRPRRLRGLA
jgi:protein-tyrosine phosphatase